MGATFLALLAFVATQGHATTDTDQPKSVRCEVSVILATNGAPDVAPELRPLKRYLENSFGNRYTRFEQLASHRLLLAADRRSELALPNDTSLGLTYLGVEGELLRLTMDLAGLKTTVKVHDGGLFFQAGRKFRDGMLVVAIRATGVTD